MRGTARTDFRYIAKFRYVAKIWIFATFAKISLWLRNFLSHPAFLLVAAACNFFNPGFKISLKLQKLIREKLQKSEKQARTNINLKIKESLRRKLIEIQIK